MAKQYNITAIITDKRGIPLSIGKNSYNKTHPYMALLANKMGEPYKINLHAEIDAILKCKDLDKAYKISIYRYNALGQLRLAKPCIICQHAIGLTPIKIIEYSVAGSFLTEKV